MKLIAGALTIALLSGCSVMGTKEDPRVQERALYTELQTKLQNQQFIAPSYTMDVGYGSTPEAARADAQKRLASQVIVSVQSYRKSDKSFDNGNFTSSESAAAYSFSTIQLEDARIFDSGVVDETYYVVLGVDSDMTEKMRREARRKLPVLSIIERLKATESPVKRINIATEGVNEAGAAGVADEQVIVRDIEGLQLLLILCYCMYMAVL
ncbi:hypothetical protein FJM67_16260 [Maribrevibacterium harenarium]|uniref:LPP20 lipoprotein n=1 Tax=Maribrevibacterium harenarium TaxID=2589817 RepID=A0A501WF08_9GAMM|nr:LPP20 family lipoprotein [Maribrevibacterium harenarium]TPE45771.1 hypothetical protein FJM67_16260 [Maribrevibacterium harenarium]